MIYPFTALSTGWVPGRETNEHFLSQPRLELQTSGLTGPLATASPYHRLILHYSVKFVGNYHETVTAFAAEYSILQKNIDVTGKAALKL